MSIMIWRPSKESFCKNWSKLWEVAVQRMQGLQELPNTSPANISQIFHCPPQTAANIWLPWECCKYLDRQISGKCDGCTKWWLMVPWGQKAEVGWESVISYYCWWALSYITSWFCLLQISTVILGISQKMLASEKKTMERKDLSKCGKKSDRPFPASAIVWSSHIFR